MADIDNKSAFIIRMRYLAPTNFKGARYAYTWPNWPSAYNETHTQYASPIDDIAKQANHAAQALVDWLNAGNEKWEFKLPKKRVSEVRFSGWVNSSPDTYVLVRTEYVKPE